MAEFIDAHKTSLVRRASDGRVFASEQVIDRTGLRPRLFCAIAGLLPVANEIDMTLVITEIAGDTFVHYTPKARGTTIVLGGR